MVRKRLSKKNKIQRLSKNNKNPKKTLGGGKKNKVSRKLSPRKRFKEGKRKTQKKRYAKMKGGKKRSRKQRGGAAAPAKCRKMITNPDGSEIRCTNAVVSGTKYCKRCRPPQLKSTRVAGTTKTAGKKSQQDKLKVVERIIAEEPGVMGPGSSTRRYPGRREGRLAGRQHSRLRRWPSAIPPAILEGKHLSPEEIKALEEQKGITYGGLLDQLAQTKENADNTEYDPNEENTEGEGYNNYADAVAVDEMENSDEVTLASLINAEERKWANCLIRFTSSLPIIIPILYSNEGVVGVGWELPVEELSDLLGEHCGKTPVNEVYNEFKRAAEAGTRVSTSTINGIQTYKLLKRNLIERYFGVAKSNYKDRGPFDPVNLLREIFEANAVNMKALFLRAGQQVYPGIDLSVFNISTFISNQDDNYHYNGSPTMSLTNMLRSIYSYPLGSGHTTCYLSFTTAGITDFERINTYTIKPPIKSGNISGKLTLSLEHMAPVVCGLFSGVLISPNIMELAKRFFLTPDYFQMLGIPHTQARGLERLTYYKILVCFLHPGAWHPPNANPNLKNAKQLLLFSYLPRKPWVSVGFHPFIQKIEEELEPVTDTTKMLNIIEKYSDEKKYSSDDNGSWWVQCLHLNWLCGGEPVLDAQYLQDLIIRKNNRTCFMKCVLQAVNNILITYPEIGCFIKLFAIHMRQEVSDLVLGNAPIEQEELLKLKVELREIGVNDNVLAREGNGDEGDDFL